MKKVVSASILLAALCAASLAQAPIPPISAGYGARGSFTVTAERFPSPLFNAENVYVFRPAGATAPVPVIFFAPGYGNTDPTAYGPLIEHIVSRGYALVFSPFQTVLADGNIHARRYATIFAGFEEAVRRYGSSFDLTRVAFVGHSFGGGASFAMLRRGVMEKGWGRNGLFVFALAPWYVYEITTKELLEFPPHAKLLVQVYESDTVNDHRIAKEVFERVNLPASEKDFVLLRDDKFQTYELDATHGTPSGSVPNALDYYGIWRLFDALADYSFNGNAAGQRIALGDGGAGQRLMGVWPDGRPVKESLAGDCVPITRAASSFLFPYDQTIADLSNVPAASFKAGASLAPDSLAVAFGKNLSTSPAVNEQTTLPTRLNGTFVKVRDGACIERLAPLFFVSPAQINYLVPAGTSAGAATVTVVNEAGAVALGTVRIDQIAPSLFAANANGQGVAAAVALRVKADGTQRFELVTRFDAATNKYVALPLDLGASDEQVFLILYGSGIRYRGAIGGVAASIGGAAAEVLFAGAQGGLAGLDQINLRVPRSLAGRGEVEVALTVEGKAANVVKLGIK